MSAISVATLRSRITTVIAARDQRVEAAAVDVRARPLALAPRRPPLARDVGDRERERAQQPVGVGEVGEELGRARALAVADHAHRRRAARSVAGEHVAAARAAGRAAARRRRSGAARSRPRPRVVGDEQPVVVLLVPAERRHVAVAAEQQAGLAGAGLRRQVALPRHQPVAAVVEPARDRRRVAVARSPCAARARRARRSRTGSRPARRSRCVAAPRRARRRTTRRW